ncbi:hypothetical protein JCM10207_001868 [Rhodosporidiobolus poonsookiae]
MSDTAQSSYTASTAGPDESLALRLPVELWLDILSHLDYVQLHKARRICKKFKELVQHSSLDARLFRRKPVKLKPNARLRLHPILDRIEGIIWEPRRALIHRYIEGDDNEELDWNAFDYPATQDFATSPACRRMVVFLDQGGSTEVENENGITVLDFLTELSEYWTGSSEARLPGQTRDWSKAPRGAVDWLVDKNGWTGWASGPWMRDDGFVQLVAGGFDS